MAEARFDQANFSQGELDLRAQARTDWEQYYKAAKQIRNCIVIPQGGVQRRWGSTAVATLSIATNLHPEFAEISTLLYDDAAIYLMVWEASSLKIYLENKLVATLVTTYANEDIARLRFAQVENRLILVNENFIPKQLIRSNDAPNAITAIDVVNMYITVTNPYVVDQILPAQFTTGATLPTTSPQIFTNRTYFVRAITALNLRIYSTPEDAAANINFYTISVLGAASNLVTQNTWNLSDISFKHLPAFDFTGGYFAALFTFTPSATTGAITITASANIFTAAMINGLYIGNGGIVRITGFTDVTHVTGYTITDFPNTNAIRGDLSFLGEPAWSASRGYPRTVSFFQNRLVLAGTPSIPNGIWLSVINDVYNFDDSETLDDNAISWYPASGSINFIRGLTSTKALIVHTNTGNWSTPVLTETPLTPKNFVLTEQNKFGIFNIQPVFIDNQIIFVDASGNNVISMVWDIGQSSYVTDNKSVAASSLINHPVDMAAFAQPQFTDGFYALFVNVDGTLAVLQTLIEQQISAWSLQNVTQTFDNINTVPCYYRKVTTGGNRAWFLVDRGVKIAGAPVAITGAFPGLNTLNALAHGMPLNAATLIQFTTSVSVPTTNPPLNLTQYFWGRGITVNLFKVYGNELDAINDTNAYTIIDAGNLAMVVGLSEERKLMLEEVNFTVYTDNSTLLTNQASATLAGLSYLNGNYVSIVANDYVLPSAQVFNGTLTLDKVYATVKIGVGFSSILMPLPVSIPATFGILYKPKHFRNLYINYYQTIGATVQGFGIPVINMQDIVVGSAPLPQDGVFEYTPMEGWESVTNEIQIIQNQPLPMTIRALSWVMDIG